MNKIIAIAAALLVLVPAVGQARETPEQLECANIERTHDSLQRSLRFHLEDGAPRRVDIDYDRLIALLAIPLDWFAESVNAMWHSSLDAYESDIRNMRERGRAQGCDWVNHVGDPPDTSLCRGAAASGSDFGRERRRCLP